MWEIQHLNSDGLLVRRFKVQQMAKWAKSNLFHFSFFFFFQHVQCWHINCGRYTLTLISFGSLGSSWVTLLAISSPVTGGFFSCWQSSQQTFNTVDCSDESDALEVGIWKQCWSRHVYFVKMLFSFSEIYHHKYIGSKYSRGIQKACFSLTFLKQAAAETGKFWFKAKAD